MALQIDLDTTGNWCSLHFMLFPFESEMPLVGAVLTENCQVFFWLENYYEITKKLRLG